MLERIIDLRLSLGLSRKEFCRILQIDLKQLIEIEKKELNLEVVKCIELM